MLILKRCAFAALALLFFSGWLPIHVAGQFRFVSWTIDDGLPQHTINAIVQTRDGYLWLATIDGLVRYDGVRFKVFERGNTPALRSNRFVCLYEDETGALWAGTEYGGLVRYQNGVFQTYTTVDGLPDNSVKELAPASGGGVLVNTEAGFVIWRGSQFLPGGEPWWKPQTTTVKTANGTHWRFADAQTRQLIKASYGKAFQPFTQPTGSYELYLFIAQGSALLDDQAGNLWGSLNGEVFRIRDGVLTRDVVQDAPVYEQMTALRYPPSFSQSEKQTSELLTACLSSDGSIWLGTRSGLLHIQQGRVLRYSTAHGLTDNSIEALRVDREGTLWVGTPKGLTRVTRQFIQGVTHVNGLPRLEVYPMIEGHDRTVWIGTSQLTRWTRGQATNFQWKGKQPNGHLLALHEDRQQRLWVSTFEGIKWFKNGRFSDFPRAPLEALRLTPEELDCFDIHEDAAGFIWLATRNGLMRWDGYELKVWRQAEGLPHDEVRVIHEDRAGKLWLGTASGLACWQNGQITSFAPQTEQSKIISLYQDQDGVLWAGSYDNGLFRYHNDEVKQITRNDGLFNDEIFHLLEDEAGYFWISSNKGLSRVSRHQLNDFAAGRVKVVNAVAYSKQDGMPSTECNAGRQPAGLKTRDGRFWFPTQMGAAMFDPREVPHNPQAPPVIIESITSQHQTLPNADLISLQPGQDNLEIAYTGLSFIKPEQVKFKYQLLGWDNDWINAGARRTAYYSNLPPGDYEFQVSAANSDGVWNDTPARLRIKVIPPFYRTLWWYGLLTLGLAGFVALAYRYRITQVRQRLTVQENFARQLIATQERERQRIAAELHDSLGQNLQVIKNRAWLGAQTKNGVSAQIQFQEINELTAAAIEEVRTIAQDLRPPNLTRLGLSSTLEEMLEEVAEATDIRFSVTIDPLDGLFTPDGELNLFRIIQEAVNNIVKHAQATQASVTIVREASGLQITIRDNGCGFAVDQPSHTGTRKNGIGLTSLSERTMMLGGKRHIISATGQGTTVTIHLPLNSNHS